MSFFDSYQAAIFDLDGTLIDSMPLWENFCNDWLRSHNRIPGESLKEDIFSMTFSQSADYVNRLYGLNLTREELISQWEEKMTGLYLAGAQLRQGVKELLDALSLKKIKLGIATYSFTRSCEAVLNHHGVLKYFSSFIYAHEFEFFSEYMAVKKDPAFWLEAANRLNVKPEKCIVFEDSFFSMEGVRAAGMGIAAVYDASCSQWPELSRAADIAVKYPGEALKYF